MGSGSMTEDSLKITENADGSFQMEWDKQDPNWKWLNELTIEQVRIKIKQAINEELQNRD